MDGSEDADSSEQRRKIQGQELDYSDPSLDVQDLFACFNERFFWGKLGMVRVKWSYTMTSRAGLCKYREPEGLCTIKLSAPLLSLRPRADLVEALLHEMIHAYLFVTRNFNDKEDHGPEFQNHMHRIKKEGGIRIRIYCPYVSEMLCSRRHMWRCAGPCRDQQPHFGYFMRTTSRAPGPSDPWWNKHMQECGGNYEKILPKQKNGKGKSRNEKGKRKKTVAGAKDVRAVRRSFGPENPSKSNPSDTSSASTAVDESETGESSKSEEQTEEVPDNPNEMEEKPGTSQSGDDFQSKPGTSQSGDDFQSKPGTSQSGDDFQSKPSTSQSGDDFQSKPGTSQSGDDFQSKPGTSQSGDDFQSKPGTSRSSDDFQSAPGTSHPGDENLQPPTRPTKKKGLKGKKRKSSDVAETSRSSDDFESTPGTSHPGDENLQPPARPTKKKGLKGKKRKSSDVAEENASAVDEKRPKVMCPVCAHEFDPELINDHVNACMEEQEFMNEISPDEDNGYMHSHSQSQFEHYPLLGDYLDEEEAADRVEASLHFFVYDEDIAGDDEPGADKVLCPCCWKWVKEGKINQHIDACLTYNTLQNNPPDSP